MALTRAWRASESGTPSSLVLTLVARAPSGSGALLSEVAPAYVTPPRRASSRARVGGSFALLERRPSRSGGVNGIRVMGGFSPPAVAFSLAPPSFIHSRLEETAVT